MPPAREKAKIVFLSLQKLCHTFFLPSFLPHTLSFVNFSLLLSLSSHADVGLQKSAIQKNPSLLCPHWPPPNKEGRKDRCQTASPSSFFLGWGVGGTETNGHTFPRVRRLCLCPCVLTTTKEEKETIYLPLLLQMSGERTVRSRASLIINTLLLPPCVDV